MTIGHGFVQARAAGAFIPGFGEQAGGLNSLHRSPSVQSIPESVTQNPPQTPRDTFASLPSVDKWPDRQPSRDTLEETLLEESPRAILRKRTLIMGEVDVEEEQKDGPEEVAEEPVPVEPPATQPEADAHVGLRAERSKPAAKPAGSTADAMEPVKQPSMYDDGTYWKTLVRI